MRNAKAVWSVIWALLSIGFLVAGALLARIQDEIGLLSYASVPAAFAAAIVALALARRARFDFQRSLGRLGGGAVADVGKALGLVGLLLSLAGLLAIVVFLVLRTLD
ncbi:MAG: hypothetical protein R3C15_06390 [Thermoleophilia bacterium]